MGNALNINAQPAQEVSVPPDNYRPVSWYFSDVELYVFDARTAIFNFALRKGGKA